MKFTQSLHKQHIGKAIRTMWQYKRERPVYLTNAENILKSMGFSVTDALTFVGSKKQNNINTNASLLYPKPSMPVVASDTHSNIKRENYLIYEDNNVLQEGISQACLLTNTLQVKNELPEKIKNLATTIPENMDDLIKRITYSSVIFDPHQEKLPKVKDPNRPCWVFPRIYGITTLRKVNNLLRKFLHVCESLCGLSVVQTRVLVYDEILSTQIARDTDFLQFSLKMDLMMTSLEPLTPITETTEYKNLVMPSIYPLHPTIGLLKLNADKYKIRNVHPIKISPFMNVHTIFINHDSEKVKNITELPVTESQIHARSMIKSFTAALDYARKRFGSDVEKLPKPVTVQCIQTDGQTFHFSVYQLNTTVINDTNETKNFWWSSPSIKLYEKAQYKNGQPCLEGYNDEVFKRFFAFYNNH